MKKMNTMLKRWSLVMAFLLILPVFAACSAATDEMKTPMPGFGRDQDGVDAPGESPDEGGETDGGDNGAISDRKLTRTVELRMETRDYDALTDQVEAEVMLAGGYTQSSSLSGDAASDSLRQAAYVLRIPSDAVDSFLAAISGGGQVLSQSSKIEDITLEYVDTESRLDALRVEQDILMGILEDAETIEDIITIQDRLTNIRYELEGFESRKRSMDNLAEYSVINLSIREVRDLTRTEEDDFGAELRSRFTQAWKDLGEGLRTLTLNLVSMWPMLLLLAAALVIVILTARSRNKKRRQDMREHRDPPPARITEEAPPPSDEEAPPKE